MRALAQVVPDRVSAGIGNLKVAAYSGIIDTTYWVYMDITEGSYGGRYGKDGMDAVDTLYANTRNNPIEDIETHYPLRVSRYELVPDGAGPGRWRGGLGSIRDITFMSAGGMSLEGDGNRFAPPGLFGGKEGTVGAVVLNPDRSDGRAMPSKFPYMKLTKGETIRTVSPCGGGYGDPFTRDPGQVLEDVRDNFVSALSACIDYGVAVVSRTRRGRLAH